MKYRGHKNFLGEVTLPDGVYVASTQADGTALIQPHRTDMKLDHTTYSDAAGNISYETSVFRVRIKNGRVRRI